MLRLSLLTTALLLAGSRADETNHCELIASSVCFGTYRQYAGGSNTFSIDVGGTYSTPTWIDLDDDGDYDVVAGDETGNIHFFENTGSSTSASYTERTGSDNPFDAILVQINDNKVTDDDVADGIPDGRAAPAFVDLDGDGA